MAGIQQTFNQLLQTASLGVGLYAHSPAGQAKYADIKARQAKEAKAKTEDPAAQAELGKVGQSSAQKALELSPTAERAQIVADYLKAENVGKAEQAASNIAIEKSKKENKTELSKFAQYTPETEELVRYSSSYKGSLKSKPVSRQAHKMLDSYIERVRQLRNQKISMNERAAILNSLKREGYNIEAIKEFTKGGKDGKK